MYKLSLLATFAVCVCCAQAGQPPVAVLRLPAGGLHPQVVVAARTLHAIYVTGAPGGGDIFYMQRAANADGFGEAIRVNSQAGSAVVAGTVRGPRLAVGDDGTVHVAWMGSGTAEPKGPDGKSPMLYARRPAGRADFEPQRNVAQKQGHLDGGGTVAAGTDGRVWVTWHGGGETEATRTVWTAVSTDAGASFAPELAVSKPGVCACCGIESAVDTTGRLQVLYRGVNAAGTRDAIWLHGRVDRATLATEVLATWPIRGCPMSTAAILPTRTGMILAWENEGRIQLRLPEREKQTLDLGVGRTFKHPALAANADGQTLVVAAVNTSFRSGGTVAWIVLDTDGAPVVRGTAPDLPGSSRPAAFATADDGFAILY